MRIRARSGWAALAATAMFVCAAQDAKALYYPELVQVANLGSGRYQWNYQVHWISSASNFELLGSNSNPISAGTPFSSDFFTLYDINGYEAGSAQAGTDHDLYQVGLTGINGPNLTPPDDSTLYNLTFRFTGGIQADTKDYTGFSFVSTSPPTSVNHNGVYSSQFTRNHNNNTKVGFSGNLDLPGAVPEPSSIALVGMGVAGLFGYGYRRRRQS